MLLQGLLEQACEDSGHVSYYSRYSGRGMFGSICVGVSGSRSRCMEVVGEAIKQLRYKLKTVQLGSSEEEQDRLFDQAIDLLLGDLHEDRMGMDFIIYWPRLQPLPEGGDLRDDDSEAAH